MIPDLFRRLKPLYPSTIERLWIEYQIADADRRREIDELITVLAIKRLGIMIGDERLILDAPPATLIGMGEYTLGSVTYPGLPPYPFRVRRNELLRHTFILGPTGTGKSTLLLNLILQLDVPFMIFDFKRNYRCLLHARRDIIVFTVGRKTAPLAINVLAPPHGVEVTEWADALADIISTAYLLLQGARNVLKEALLAAHREYGDRARLADAFALVRHELYATRAGSRRYGWLESATRSLEELTKGAFGSALNATNATPLDELLTCSVVFELHGFGEDQRRFFCLYFLQGILLLRKSSTAAREVLQHLLVFDEAHNVFPREKFGEPSVPARLAREVREYGEAIIAATQQADVSESLIANSGFKLILRCDYPKDVQFASQLLQIEPKWLPKLAIGHCIARLPVRFYSPFQFTYPDQPLKNTGTPDAFVHAAWNRHPLPTSSPSAAALPVSARDDELLRDVNTTPICGITQRYTRLGWNPKIGNAVKDSVIQQRLAAFEPVTTPTGIVKILSLTDAGRAHLVSIGIDVMRSRHGGAEHEYWKHSVKRKLETLGYAVSEERSIGDGKTVDLHAERMDETLWVEIETGRSDVQANIEKCRPLSGRKIVIFTTAKVRDQHRTVPDQFLFITTTELNILQ